jgi:ComF family protein
VDWTVAALRLARSWSAGPCPCCASRRGAPLCEACRSASRLASAPWTSAVGLDALFFAGAYYSAGPGRALSPLGRALRACKDHGDRHAARCLAAIFATTLAASLPRVDVVVPVPSDAARVRARGLAPASWLARSLAGALRMRLEARALRRRPGHPPQRGLDGDARRLNAARAFTLGPSPVAGYTVLLVDDVVTTGATLSACGRLLRERGAAGVICAALACADESVLAECRSKTARAGKRNTAAPPR